MESPLTQQSRPEVFQQKVVELYEVLFKVRVRQVLRLAASLSKAQEESEEEKSEGFWREFFLLKPDKASLQRTLNETDANDLLHIQVETRQLFLRAIRHVKAGLGPADANALDTLTAYLSAVLSKKYNNPSSDIINVLAGLDQVDVVLTDFVASLDIAIKTGRTLDVRQKAIEVALAMISGAYQTSLLSYFTHRDLFPSLMKVCLETSSHT